MKKFMKYLYVILFLVISLVPAGLFVFTYSGVNDGGINIEKHENLDFPQIYTDGVINYSFDDECEEWLNQNIPFRGVLLSKINLVLCDYLKIPCANVVAGERGWIFSNETIGDYMNTNAFDGNDMQSIGITLSLIQEKIEADGGQFLFMPVPNKNSIYPEYMPVRYLRADENNLTKIYEVLDDRKVSYINLKDVLTEEKTEAPEKLYYKRDTHWTPFGAYASYEELMKKLGKVPVEVDTDKYTYAYTRKADLDQLLYPLENRMDEEFAFEDEIDCENFEFIRPSGVEDTRAQLENFMSDKEDHDNNFTTKKRKSEDNSSLYMVRDSFARALLPYMIDSYNEATFVRTTTPSVESVSKGSDMIYEICERNLKNLIISAPYMYAPEREGIKEGRGEYASELNKCFCLDEGYAYRIFGTIDRKMAGKDGCIYLELCDKDAVVKVFEAFPIYEEGLLKESLNEENLIALGLGKSDVCGYSLYIDKNALDKKDYSLKIATDEFESDILAKIDMNDIVTKDDNDGNKEALCSSDVADKGQKDADAHTDKGGGEEYDDNADSPEYYPEAKPNPYPDENEKHQLVYRGVNIGIGDNFNYLKSELGNQAAPSEIVTSCLSGVDAILYYYPYITLETDMEGEIYYISLMDNSYTDGEDIAATAAGISIGSNKMDIWEKLGNPTKENDKNCVYRSEHLTVTYSYKSGEVTSVILEDNKFKTEEEVKEEEKKEEEEIPAGVEYESGNTYLYDPSHVMQTGWKIIDGSYYFFDRLTGERVVGQVVDGIAIGPDGEVNLTEYDVLKIATMMKANNIVAQTTSPGDSMEVKRRKVFDWVLSFPYHRYRHLKDCYEQVGIEIIEANDIFDTGAGDCVSEAAALAFLFHEIGYKNVYWVHDTGHSWVRSDDRLFDPLFAEARDFDANYDAPFTDYRATMVHSMLIY